MRNVRALANPRSRVDHDSDKHPSGLRSATNTVSNEVQAIGILGATDSLGEISGVDAIDSLCCSSDMRRTSIGDGWRGVGRLGLAAGGAHSCTQGSLHVRPPTSLPRHGNGPCWASAKGRAFGTSIDWCFDCMRDALSMTARTKKAEYSARLGKTCVENNFIC